MKMPKISKSLVFTFGGAVILIFQLFGVKIDAPYVNEILEGVCAILIVLGLISLPKDGEEEPSGDVVLDDNLSADGLLDGDLVEEAPLINSEEQADGKIEDRF